jgi:hypothetical protein
MIDYKESILYESHTGGGDKEIAIELGLLTSSTLPPSMSRAASPLQL